jgi:hypothetical protein
MNTTNTNTSHKYDKPMIRDFLLHLAAELRVQQAGFEGKPAPDKLRQGVQKLRAKYGVSLLPAAENVGILTNNPDGDGEEEREATRQVLVRLRADQFDHTLAIFKLMDELDFYTDARQSG